MLEWVWVRWRWYGNDDGMSEYMGADAPSRTIHGIRARIRHLLGGGGGLTYTTIEYIRYFYWNSRPIRFMSVAWYAIHRSMVTKSLMPQRHASIE